MKTIDVIDNRKGFYSIYEVSKECALSVRSIQRHTKLLVSLGKEHVPEFDEFEQGSFYTKEQLEFLKFFCTLKRSRVSNWKCLEQWKSSKANSLIKADLFLEWSSNWIFNNFNNSELLSTYKDDFYEYFQSCS